MGLITANSLVAQAAVRVWTGSRAARLVQGLVSAGKRAGAACGRVVSGSVILGWLEVGDYLDEDHTVLTTWIDKAFSGSGSTAIFRRWAGKERLRAAYESAAQSLIFKEVREWSGRLGQPVSMRGIMAAVLALLAGFYLVHLVQALVYPEILIISPWSAGLVQGVVLAAILLLIFSKRIGRAPVFTGTMMERIGHALWWLPGKIMPWIRHVPVVWRRWLRGGPPPVEGGMR